MKDEASTAPARLKEIASRRDDGVAMCLWSEEARVILAHIAALEARAEAAEAKVIAAEERGLVFNTLPDGRLDFCAIRAGSRLWDSRVRAEAAEATIQTLAALFQKSPSTSSGPQHNGWAVTVLFNENEPAREFHRALASLAAAPAAPEKPRAEALTAEVARLREAVTWLLNCHRGLNRHGHGVDGDGYWGNIDAATAFAREALAATPAVPEKPSGENGWLPADPPAEWIEAMADSVHDELCKLFDTYLLHDEEAAKVAQAAYAALARKMGGGDAE